MTITIFRKALLLSFTCMSLAVLTPSISYGAGSDIPPIEEPQKKPGKLSRIGDFFGSCLGCLKSNEKDTPGVPSEEDVPNVLDGIQDKLPEIMETIQNNLPQLIEVIQTNLPDLFNQIEGVLGREQVAEMMANPAKFALDDQAKMKKISKKVAKKSKKSQRKAVDDVPSDIPEEGSSSNSCFGGFCSKKSKA